MPTMDPANSNPSRAEELKLLANEAFKGKPFKSLRVIISVAHLGFCSFLCISFNNLFGLFLLNLYVKPTSILKLLIYIHMP